MNSAFFDFAICVTLLAVLVWIMSITKAVAWLGKKVDKFEQNKNDTLK